MSRSADALSSARSSQSGFGLIEVLYVMIIIGILCAIAIPMYLGQRERAKNAVVREGGRAIALAVLSCVAASADDTWPAQADQASLAAYLPTPEWPTSPLTGQPPRAVALSSDGDHACKPVAGGWHLHRVCLRNAAPYHVL